ncbi:hypothetical protein INT44_007685 [Umbelopsis vinacea]|uniref:AAA+ ATPase domain-containing protein n=1 Tax=Umbelopsis vinacea TaxID=44442 RepID=A0A8H7PJK2_9FUNG|nr:hypothetical protein INT44_007685 [Umbelopsis vinacea]
MCRGPSVEIRYEGFCFSAKFIEKEESSRQPPRELNTPDDLISRKLGAITEPPIEVWCKPQSGINTVDDLSKIIRKIAKEYMEMVEAQKRTIRSRYEYSASGKWTRVCNLPEIRGLETVALTEEHEELLSRSINSFETSKEFYGRIGSPWRMGILLYGCPGTGKTSLVFAIASTLKRDIYFMNLNNIDSDSELLSAFASIPCKSIVVFEDIDAMTPVLHRRDPGKTDRGEDQKFGLSSMLGVLDGHTLEEGIIFVMTTNYIDKLDPALIRPGRMDLHLQLKYATHHQMEHIYRLVGGDSLLELYPDLRREIPECVIPPSEIMQLMVLLRNNKHLIPQQLQELASKRNGSSLQL